MTEDEKKAMLRQKAIVEVNNAYKDINRSKVDLKDSICHTLFTRNVYDVKDKLIYATDADKLVTHAFPPEYLDENYPSWKKKKEEKKVKEDADDPLAASLPVLRVGPAYIYKEAYWADDSLSLKDITKPHPSALYNNKCVNLYQIPYYLRTYSDQKPPVDIPTVYLDFFEHLYTTEDSRDYLMRWLAWSLDPEVKQLLYLCNLDSVEGVGKGMLSSVARLLHGKVNSKILSDKFLKSAFNFQAVGLTLGVVNEVEIQGKEQNNRIKSLIDGEFEVERKGFDIYEVLNQSKWIFNSNDPAIRTTKSSRRFAILDLTDTPLLKNVDLLAKYGQKAKTLEKELLDKENIAKLGHYLTHYRRFVLDRNPDKYNPGDKFISSKLLDLVEMSLKAWEYDVIYKLPSIIWSENDAYRREVQRTRLNPKNHIHITKDDFLKYVNEQVDFFSSSLKSVRFPALRKLIKDYQDVFLITKERVSGDKTQDVIKVFQPARAPDEAVLPSLVDGLGDLI